MITVGAVFRGPELRGCALDAVVRTVGRAAMKATGDFEFGSAPATNVVFHVPGTLGGPDWDGLRDGTFSRKERMLMVQVAVPEQIVGSEEAMDFIIEALRGANAIAFDVFEEKGMPFPLREAEALVDRIEEIATDVS